MLVLDSMPSRKSLTFQSSPPQPLDPSLKPWSSGEFVVNSRLTRSLRMITLKPLRRKLRRLLTFRKSLTLMSWFMESLR
ncbi:hypothetical protein Gorai_003335 [Gossypium raimondii]|uniref:Uncharacterized protein n=1 Tax=Gossypium raimondii TaxID=29730 RepID=A0A7J8QNM4_GOSRA|nr:hypothetical protein [Gossypium raimondii]